MSKEVSKWQKRREAKKEEENQKQLRKEEIRMMRGWNKKERQEYVERFRSYRGDTRYRKCGWFGHIAHYCRR